MVPIPHLRSKTATGFPCSALASHIPAVEAAAATLTVACRHIDGADLAAITALDCDARRMRQHPHTADF